MAATAPIRFVHNRRDRRAAEALWLQVIFALLGGLALFLVTIFLLSIGYRLAYAGRIFPGVSVAGVDVAGLKPMDAAAKLQTALTYPVSGRLVFRDGETTWVETPARLGLAFDSTASAQAAFDAGRAGGLFQSLNTEWAALQTGVDVPPVTLLDQRVAHSYLQNLASQIDKPVTEASLVINGLEVASRPGQIGRRLNVDSTLVYLTVQMQSFRDGEVPLVIEQQPPQVLDAAPQAEAARRLLTTPFMLSIPNARPGDPGPWLIQPTELAPLLKVGRVYADSGNAQYVVQLDEDKLKPVLDEIAKQVNRKEENARFTFDEASAQLSLLRPAVIGYQLNLSASVAEIEKAVGTGQTSASLNLTTTNPQVDDTATAQQLGITQVVSAQTTYFYGSGAARLQNIQAASSKFHGILVAPGQTFSMGDYLDDISLENGFAEALIIYGGQTIKGVGGGVCQVSTTLFRTVFFGGLPVNERYAHAYRVSYYEQTASGQVDPQLAGLDATVYFPLVDFKFTNDSPSWLLMDTFYDERGRSLTWKFYSSSDGRTVSYQTTGPTNITPAPPPVIQENPDLKENEAKQVDWAAQGADVLVNRIVYAQDGKIRFVDKFQTHYEPWAAVCQYGAGITNPQKLFKKMGLCQNN